MEVIHIDLKDQTAPVSQFGLSKILVLTKEVSVAYQEAESIDGFTGITSTNNAYKAIEAILSQTSQTVALYGTTNTPIVDNMTADLATKDFFFVAPVGFTIAEFEAIATWCTANEKMCVITPAFDSSVSDMTTMAKSINSDQVAIFAHKGTIAIAGDSSVTPAIPAVPAEQVYFASAITGLIAPKQAGSVTWALKSPNGVPKNYYAGAEETELTDDTNGNVNIFTEYLGRGITQKGKTTKGTFIDVTRDKFWLKHTLKETLGQLFMNADKVPFTSTGQSMIEDKLSQVVQTAEDMGILAPDETTIFVPAPLDLLETDRANRKWTGIKINGRIQGAVQSAFVEVTLTV